jgi:hypothetical protein
VAGKKKVATPAQIRAQVDTALSNLWGSITARQDTYFANHGSQRYWQGLITHGSIPADGVTATPTVGSTVPSYEVSADAWPAGILSQSLPMALEIHQYVRPDGVAGYVGIVRVVIAGNLWMRAQDSGSEPYRTFGWTNMGAFP